MYAWRPSGVTAMLVGAWPVGIVAVPANKPLAAVATPATYEQRFAAVRPAGTHERGD
jgi:hypothetical protein